MHKSSSTSIAGVTSAAVNMLRNTTSSQSITLKQLWSSTTVVNRRSFMGSIPSCHGSDGSSGGYNGNSGNSDRFDKPSSSPKGTKKASTTPNSTAAAKATASLLDAAASMEKDFLVGGQRRAAEKQKKNLAEEKRNKSMIYKLSRTNIIDEKTPDHISSDRFNLFKPRGDYKSDQLQLRSYELESITAKRDENKLGKNMLQASTSEEDGYDASLGVNAEAPSFSMDDVSTWIAKPGEKDVYVKRLPIDWTDRPMSFRYDREGQSIFDYQIIDNNDYNYNHARAEMDVPIEQHLDFSDLIGDRVSPLIQSWSNALGRNYTFTPAEKRTAMKTLIFCWDKSYGCDRDFDLMKEIEAYRTTDPPELAFRRGIKAKKAEVVVDRKKSFGIASNPVSDSERDAVMDTIYRGRKHT